jgi:hypothetical protein
VKGKSQLIIKQVKGECYCKDPQLAAYMIHVQKLERIFKVPDLSIKASTWAPIPDGVLERRLQQPIARPTEPGKEVESSTSRLAVPAALIPWSPPKIIGITGNSVHPGVQDREAQVSPDTWIMEIWTYLNDNILPNDSASADWIAQLAKRYTLVEGDLYRCGTNGVLMQCIS